eukprot:3303992-Rhodomonas_salina.1
MLKRECTQRRGAWGEPDQDSACCCPVWSRLLRSSKSAASASDSCAHRSVLKPDQHGFQEVQSFTQCRD